MKKLLLSFALLLSALYCQAQYPKILSDPQVVWAAEIELLITPEEPADWENPDSINQSIVLKTMHTGSPDSLLEQPQGLTGYLFNLAWEGSQPVFDANEPTRRLSPADLDRLLVRRDTAEFSFDPEAPERPANPYVFVQITGADECPLLRVRQLLFYREKNADFGLLTLSLGPTLPDGRTFFWWNVPESAQKQAPRLPRLDQASVTWARRIITRAAAPEIKAVPTIQKQDFALMPGFLNTVRNRSAVEVLNLEWKPLSLDDREWIFSHVDTVMVFDLNSYEGTEKAVKFELNPDQVHRLRLVEDWYWDNRTKQLYTRLVAVAPLLDMFSTEGEFLYLRPLFYRKCKG